AGIEGVILYVSNLPGARAFVSVGERSGYSCAPPRKMNMNLGTFASWLRPAAARRTISVRPNRTRREVAHTFLPPQRNSTKWRSGSILPIVCPAGLRYQRVRFSVGAFVLETNRAPERRRKA